MLLKRAFDILASFFGLLVLSPFLLVAGLLVRFSSEGPILFRQARAGRHGIPFTIYKFRTMFVDHGGSSVSVKGERRITPIGAVLRKLKIDEMPELWNILIGDMSFVGPRPDMSEYVERLKGEERNILKVRPGLTSPASIKYYNEELILSQMPDPHKYFDEVIWPDKVRMNLDYYYHINLFNDITIIIKTITRLL